MKGIIGFILIECNKSFDSTGIQVLLFTFVCAGLLIFALIGIELKKYDAENNYLKIEKYIDECNTYISLLYEMYLTNYLLDELNNRNIKLYSSLPIIWEDAFQIEIIIDDKKMIIIFYEDRIMYAFLKIDKYEFDINEAKWKEESFKEFSSKKEIIDYIEEKYYKLTN